jgi:hypothetical protein
MRVRVMPQLLERGVRSLARSSLSSGALCFAGDGCGIGVAPVATSRGSSVPRGAAKALASQRRAAEYSVETPAKRNNSSIVPSSGNWVGIRLKFDSALMWDCFPDIADSKSTLPAMECLPAPSIPPEFWAELKRQNLIEQNAPTPTAA